MSESNTTRRGALGAILASGAAAAVTALALPAAVIAAPVDPIFAAIARHIVVRDALIEAIPRADEVEAKLEGREVTKADEDAFEALNVDEEAAFLELLVIVPTTLEGRRALLQHLVQRDEDGISEPIGEIAARLLRLPMFAQEEASWPSHFA
jgi:hypothetical protein